MFTDNYPIGTADDPKAPWNEPLTTEVTIEVSVELGTIITLEILDIEDFKAQLEKALIDKFNISNDIILNNYRVYNIN